MDITKARLLILNDGRIGGLNQSLGVAAMLGFNSPETVTMKRKKLPWMLGWLPVGMVYENLPELENAAARADLLIGAGHGTSRIIRYLKEKHPHLFTVAMMRPSGKVADYDVVVAPKHDGLKPAENLITTLGNCNRITRELVGKEAERWSKRLASVQGVKVAVMVGGPSKHGNFTAREARQLIRDVVQALKTQATQGAGLLVSTSRRSGAEITKAVQEELKASGLGYHFWRPDDPDNRDNPYFAYLGLAHAVVITPDSTSMVSEAATAGKPLYLWGSEKQVPKKFRTFYLALASQGRMRWWQPSAPTPLTLRPPAAGLMDTLLVAGFIRAKWQKRLGRG